jgi:hypothetical protein
MLPEPIAASQRCGCYLFYVVELRIESGGVALLKGGNQVNHLPIVLLSEKIPQSISQRAGGCKEMSSILADQQHPRI